jgi:hypothetical protein
MTAADSLRYIFAQPEIKYPLASFLLARLLLSTLGLALWGLGLVPAPVGPGPDYQIQPVHGFPAEPLLGIWQRYDAVHYMRIALEGYSAVHLTAFYPLYPALIRLAIPLAGGNALLAALAISNLACLAALIVFYRLMKFEGFDDAPAQRALLYCLFFPAGFFLLLPYTEALFLLLALLCMQAVRQGRWGWAALAATAAALTRFHGLALALVLGVEALQQAGWQVRRAVPRLWITLAPVAAAGSFLLWRSGAGWPSMNDLLLIWGRLPGPPWQGLLLTTRQFLSGQAPWTAYVDYPATLMMLVALPAVVRRLPASYGVYFGALLLLNLSQYAVPSPLVGQARYALVLFPAFMILAGLWQPASRAWLHGLAIAGFVAVWAYYACLVVLWGFVG